MSQPIRASVAKQVLQAKTEEMSIELTQAFIATSIMERSTPEELQRVLKEGEIEQLHPYKVLNAQLNALIPGVVTENVKAFLVFFCMSNLVKVGLMVGVIVEEVEQKRHTKFTMGDLGFLFPTGFPTDAEFIRIWDGIKKERASEEDGVRNN